MCIYTEGRLDHVFSDNFFGGKKLILMYGRLGGGFPMSLKAFIFLFFLDLFFQFFLHVFIHIL